MPLVGLSPAATAILLTGRAILPPGSGSDSVAEIGLCSLFGLLLNSRLSCGLVVVLMLVLFIAGSTDLAFADFTAGRHATAPRLVAEVIGLRLKRIALRAVEMGGCITGLLTRHD
jgi:hypothetical protein